jgi:hypothetical protein
MDELQSMGWKCFLCHKLIYASTATYHIHDHVFCTMYCREIYLFNYGPDSYEKKEKENIVVKEYTLVPVKGNIVRSISLSNMSKNDNK